MDYRVPVSEAEPIIPVMEDVRTDEILPEITATARVSSMEPAGFSATIKGVLGDIVAKAVSPIGNTLTICKQPFLDFIISCFNKVLLQVFRLWVHRLQGNQ